MERRDVWKAKEVMKDMTWPERIDYIWTYFSVPIIAVSVGLVVLISILVTVLAPRKQVLLTGVTMDVTLTQDGQRYLTDKLFATLGGTDADKETVDLVERYLGSREDYENYTAQVMAMVGLVAAQELDYALLDAAALEQFAPGGMFTDVSTLLTAQQLAQFEGKFYCIPDEEGASVPVAIDISDLPFIKTCAPKEEKVYIAFPGNTSRTDKLDAFFDWLLAWEKE